MTTLKSAYGGDYITKAAWAALEGDYSQMNDLMKESSPEGRVLIMRRLDEIAQFDKELKDSIRQWRKEYDEQFEGYGALRFCNQ
jgi:hypothetical protein